MWKNYLKTTLRSLSRQKLYAAINVLGLAVGLAFCVLVLLFVRDELSYDRFHEKADRLYRLYRDPAQADSPIDRELAMPIPAGPAMQATFPEVEAFVRIDFDGAAATIRHEGELFEQAGVLAADPSFFEAFSFPLLQGDAATALDDPQSVVLTEAVARKYFGDANPLGQTLSVRLAGEYVELRVTGVAKTPPANSSIPFTLVFPYDLFVQRYDFMQRAEDRWDATRSTTFILLRESADAAHVQAQMPQFMETHLGAIYNEMRAEGRLQASEGPPAVYRLQPMTDIHLNPDVPGGLVPPSNPMYSYILAGIALAVLLIACINFTILALGRSARRTREVGIRKAVGAQRGQLMVQFWGEALLLSALGLGFGLGLARMFLPVFNELAGKSLALGSLEWGWAVAVAGTLLVVTSLVAGSYPALVLARVRPAATLRDQARIGGAGRLTRGLIVAQFTLSVFLITSTLGMAQQLRHMRTLNLGFQGEQVVVIPTRGLDGERVLERYRTLAEEQPGIIAVAGANVMLGRGLWRRGFQYDGELKQVAVFRVTPEYLETLRMNLLAGRPFDPQRATDSSASILVNEAFARAFNWPEPVGRTLSVDWGEIVNPTVIGVVEDFHYQSLRSVVEPAMLYTNPMDPVLNVYVRLRPDDVPAALEQLRATWQSLTQEVPFEYRFLDDSMDRLYASEERWSRIVGYGGLFAVVIACLGLFGMAALTAYRRTKEIGIRKVLGASVMNIAVLLSKDFARLVVVAVVLAAPLAYLAMQRWLEGFADRIALGPWLFLGAGLLVLLVALVTVSTQAVRAALADPVQSLRHE